jgi:hypothetical protein
MKTIFALLILSAVGVAMVDAGIITLKETEFSDDCQIAFAHMIDLSSDGNVFPNDYGFCSQSEEEEGRETQNYADSES